MRAQFVRSGDSKKSMNVGAESLMKEIRVIYEAVDITQETMEEFGEVIESVLRDLVDDGMDVISNYTQESGVGSYMGIIRGHALIANPNFKGMETYIGEELEEIRYNDIRLGDHFNFEITIREIPS